MDIDITNALAIQPLVCDEPQHLVGHGHHSCRRIPQQFEGGCAVTQFAASVRMYLPMDGNSHGT
jgi:hypothetical protein